MNDCIFCKIINGEIPSDTIYENSDFKIILDISPANPGHCLILPKRHAANIFEMDIDSVKEAFALAKKAADAVKSAGLSQGVNILQNNGECAGQSVDHFHIHVIPRKKDDNVTLNQEFSKFSEEEKAKAKNALLNALIK